MEAETTTGEDLRRIRQSLNISEADIIGGGIEKDLLNLIESDATPLKTDDAKIICKSINKILEERNMDLIVDVEDLLNPRRYEAKEKVEVYISQLDKHRVEKDYVIDPDDLDDLEFLLNEYDLVDKKIKAYEVIGDIYFNSRDYEKEYEYMLKAWELRTRYPKRNQNYRIMIKLASNYIDRGKYEDVIRIYQNALLNAETIPNKYLIHIYYNYALAYYRLKMYSVSLEIISDLLQYSMTKDYDLWRKTYILEGVCYLEMGEYESALSSYTKALQVITFTGYSDLKYLIYANIAEVYTKLKDENRAQQYIDGILKDIDKLDKDGERYCKICHGLATVYESLDNLEKAVNYYKLSLEYASKNNQQNYILKNITALTELNTKIRVENIHTILEEYNSIIISNINAYDGLLATFKSLKSYIQNKEYNGLEKLIDNIIKYQGGKSI
ncbi:hypothetical protein [Tissierella sp.]|uniref:tetratricopeptide repeat protein n=1 Tax=Tissierella sp. TaxID=41274 RepID=UPI0028667D80|nr:hypothetical protein [Tissierella sp.]MDR7857402.1 hypothetical protein [Tissierella sp.]